MKEKYRPSDDPEDDDREDGEDGEDEEDSKGKRKLADESDETIEVLISQEISSEKPSLKGAKFVDFKRTIGKDFLDTESRNAVASPLDGVVELVVNEWDADASRVNITHKPGESIAIAGNGYGMLPDEINDFLRQGDSIKKRMKQEGKTTPKGRTPLGEFGKASIGIRVIGESYMLVTSKGGYETRLSERFGELLTIDKVLHGIVRTTDKTAHGTTIKIDGLAAPEQGGFTTPQLYQYLADIVPPVPEKEFVVYVNDKPVVPRVIENATKFRIDQKGSKVGQVTGFVYFSARPINGAGVHVRVNRRRIGRLRV